MGIMSSRKNQMVAFIVLVLVLVMVYINFVAPLKEERSSKQQLLTQRQMELENLNKRTAGTQALGAEEQVSLSKARNRIPEVPDVEGLIRDVRMLEVVSKMPLASYNFEVGKLPEASPVQAQAASAPAAAAGATGSAPAGLVQTLAIPIKLNTTAKGDYQQIHRFLEELQSLDRIMQVDKMSFIVKTTTPVKLNATKKEITVNVALVSYYAPGLQKFFKTPLPVDYSIPVGKTNPIY